MLASLGVWENDQKRSVVDRKFYETSKRKFVRFKCCEVFGRVD